MATTITIEQMPDLDKLLISNPAFEKKVQKIIGAALIKAARNVSASIPLKRDPRGARRAVRAITYRKIMGGNINILPRRRCGSLGTVPSSTRGRLDRTEKIMSYDGPDRGFILRFLNDGTDDRTASHMNSQKIRRGSVSERPKNRQYKTSVIGGRGSIMGSRFFGALSEAAIERAIDDIMPQIDKLITEQIAKNNG